MERGQRDRSAAERALTEGRYPAAIALYRDYLAAFPDDADSWYNLGWSCRAAGDFAGALDAYGSALAAGVRDAADVHANRAAIMSEHIGDTNAAIDALKQALALDPGHAVALLNLGTLQEDLGDRDAAIHAYRDLLKADPHHPRALTRLAALTDFPSDLTEIIAGLVANPLLGLDARSELGFALARAHDRAGNYTAAFAHLRTANQAARDDLHASERYDPDASARQVEAVIASFSAADRRPLDLNASPAPIFICGMFRSGSTLVEHILGAHPDIVAGGELEAVPLVIAAHFPRYPDDAASAPSTTVADARETYWRVATSRLQPGRRLTDKRPDNILHVGLIKRLFPDAKIVITRRNLIDNLLSIYFLDFTRAVPYAFDLAEAAHWAGQCARLTRHWQAIFPGDVHIADYDRLIADPETAIADLLEFVSLPPSQACLEFHRQPQIVRTPSAWQVRQPLFRSSSGRAENYRADLAPIIPLLEEIASGDHRSARDAGRRFKANLVTIRRLMER